MAVGDRHRCTAAGAAVGGDLLIPDALPLSLGGLLVLVHLHGIAGSNCCAAFGWAGRCARVFGSSIDHLRTFAAFPCLIGASVAWGTAGDRQPGSPRVALAGMGLWPGGFAGAGRPVEAGQSAVVAFCSPDFSLTAAFTLLPMIRWLDRYFSGPVAHQWPALLAAAHRAGAAAGAICASRSSGASFSCLLPVRVVCCELGCCVDWSAFCKAVVSGLVLCMS